MSRNRLRPAALRRAPETPTGMFASSQQLAAEMLGLTDPADRQGTPEEEVETPEPRPRRRRRRKV